MLKDMMIAKLKEINEEAVSTGNAQNIVTRLFYADQNGKREYVEDFTPFASRDYMTHELQNALANGTTLTTKQQRELGMFIIEKTFEYAGD